MDSILKRFLLELILAITLVFGIHITVLHFASSPLFENLIVASYTVNGALAILIFVGLYLLKTKYKNQVGFLFMAGSFLKFIVFFLFFLPVFKEDGSTNKLEFASFFIPYIVCLIVETLGVMKMLRD